MLHFDLWLMPEDSTVDFLQSTVIIFLQSTFTTRHDFSILKHDESHPRVTESVNTSTAAAEMDDQTSRYGQGPANQGRHGRTDDGT